jgi:hypothetical protein
MWGLLGVRRVGVGYRKEGFGFFHERCLEACSIVGTCELHSWSVRS